MNDFDVSTGEIFFTYESRCDGRCFGNIKIDDVVSAKILFKSDAFSDYYELEISYKNDTVSLVGTKYFPDALKIFGKIAFMLNKRSIGDVCEICTNNLKRKGA